VTLGWGATASHAAEEGDPSLIGAVVGTVKQVAEVLPDAVEEPVAAVVDTVEETTTTKAVRSVTKSVDTVRAATPVKKVTDSVTRTVKKVPVVREVVAKAGLPDVVDGVGDAATDVVDAVADSVDAVVGAVVPASGTPTVPDTDPIFPLIPSASTDTVVDDADTSRAASAVPPAAEAHESASLRHAVDAAPVVSTAAAGISSTWQPRSAAPVVPVGLPGPAHPVGGLAAASHGAPSPVTGSGALPSHGPASTPHASVRVDRPVGEVLPASPVFPPSVSPD
jgi:hypothetical protein